MDGGHTPGIGGGRDPEGEVRPPERSPTSAPVPPPRGVSPTVPGRLCVMSDRSRRGLLQQYAVRSRTEDGVGAATLRAAILQAWSQLPRGEVPERPAPSAPPAGRTRTGRVESGSAPRPGPADPRAGNRRTGPSDPSPGPGRGTGPGRTSPSPTVISTLL